MVPCQGRPQEKFCLRLEKQKESDLHILYAQKVRKGKQALWHLAHIVIVTYSNSYSLYPCNFPMCTCGILGEGTSYLCKSAMAWSLQVGPNSSSWVPVCLYSWQHLAFLVYCQSGYTTISSVLDEETTAQNRCLCQFLQSQSPMLIRSVFSITWSSSATLIEPWEIHILCLSESSQQS